MLRIEETQTTACDGNRKNTPSSRGVQRKLQPVGQPGNHITINFVCPTVKDIPLAEARKVHMAREELDADHGQGNVQCLSVGALVIDKGGKRAQASCQCLADLSEELQASVPHGPARSSAGPLAESMGRPHTTNPWAVIWRFGWRS